MSFPLITVIIPCYNHGHFLGKAIDSVLNQSYRNVEVIVVDDGSWDNTREVACNYGLRVTYIHKQNGGLSAARNSGIEHAKGEYIVFLDADDWLYHKALEINLHQLQQNPKAAFVSGSHEKLFLDQNFQYTVNKVIERDHYQYLLKKGNYIGVPAAVMYRKWVLQEMRFDESLKACEDYDLYLRIARKYPILHHTEKVATYRIHASSMSANPIFMFHAATNVLDQQKAVLRNKNEIQAYNKGKIFWEKYYSRELYKKMILRTAKVSAENLIFLITKQPIYILKLSYRFLIKKK